MLPTLGFTYIRVCTQVFFLTFRITTQGEMLSRINALSYPGGNTNTYQGLQRMRTVFRDGGIRGNARRVGIVITDGQPTISIDLTDDEAQAAQDEGIQMYAVGVTNSVDANTLEYLSSQPRTLNQNYFTSANFGELRTILNRLLSVACPTLAPTTPTTTREVTRMSSIKTLQILAIGYFTL